MATVSAPPVVNDMERGFPIVAVGASAGGLEALEGFFKPVPADCGMAFVVVQHLDPTHKSILTDLIKRVTPLEVLEVTDGMSIESNCVYIIPPNRDMAILHRSLQLIEPTARRGVRLPIDYFLRSLSQDQGELAVCIILSGTGTDGTLGLKSIKEEGGMVMVQAPETAKYDGMPRSAIATQLVDLVLPPEKMAEKLISYTKNAFSGQIRAPSHSTPKHAEHLKKIYLLLRNQTGHDFTYYKPTTILRRIERRMTVNQISQLPEYVQYLQQSPLEVETLFKELLIGVSNFFRDPEAFESLEEKVIPTLFKEKPLDEPIRVWVPGCATGEEAYSLAILLREKMEELGQEYKLQVFATDIDDSAIEIARAGIYPASIAVDISPERLRRFFLKQENSYQVTKTIRDILVFAEQNVIKDPPFSRLDLISCRNLLIYLEGQLQKRLLPLFHYALRKDRHLFLGCSETIGDSKDLFSIVDRKWKIYRRKDVIAASETGIEMMPAPFPLTIGEPERSASAIPARMPGPKEITEHLLLDDYAPACVLVSEKGEGLYFHGDTGKYLKPPVGEASWNILGLAREGLRLDLSTALRKVAVQKKPMRFENVKIQTNGDPQVINLTVKPVPEHPGQGNAMLVVFESIKLAETEKSEALSSEPTMLADRRAAELERELRSTREYLQTIIEELETSNEELKSTNEELQSSNEELQSTNEELETSKEELQSVNEELVTVNTEHEVKLDELSKASNDMANLLASTEVGTIFLDNNLHIQRFTPAATKLVKLIHSDVGRPLSDIATHITDDSLSTDVNKVLDDLTPREREVLTKGGKWYLIRIRPYRTTENIIEGAVITCIEITEQKQVQERLLALSNAVKHSPISVVITDTKGVIGYVNDHFVDITGYKADEILDKNINVVRSEGTPETVFSAMWQTLRKGDIWIGELQNQRKNGTIYTASVAIYPVKGTAGQITHYVSIQTEIAEADSKQ